MPVDNLWITTYPHLWITYPQPVDNFSHGLTFFLKMCKYPYIGLSFAFLFFGGNKKPPADLTLLGGLFGDRDCGYCTIDAYTLTQALGLGYFCLTGGLPPLTPFFSAAFFLSSLFTLPPFRPASTTVIAMMFLLWIRCDVSHALKQGFVFNVQANSPD